MLTAKNISKNFGEIKVLDNINLNVEKGSIVSIYGILELVNQHFFIF